MANYTILDSTLMGLADAVREKTGKSESLTPLQMKDEILAMQYYGGNLGALPVLDTQFPKDIIDTFLTESTNATFTVKIAEHGNPASYSYQWYIDSNPVEGATNSTYTFLNITDTCSHTVYCTVTNKMGTVTTRTAQLNMTKLALPVLNASYPQDSNITVINNEIKSATFKVEISKNGIPNEYQYQWYVNGTAVNGATNNIYIRNNLSETAIYSIYCKVTNLAGTVQSRTATLKVSKYVSPILNSSYPKDVSMVASANGATTVSVSISSDGIPASYTYQWYMNNSAISGATQSTYTITGLTAAVTKTIYCVVTNAAGSVTSRTATLIVQDPMPVGYTYGGNHKLIQEDAHNWRMELYTSGKLVLPRDIVVDFYIHGGGGAGGASGYNSCGGGGGGDGWFASYFGYSAKAKESYDIVVGAGGSGKLGDGGTGGSSSAFGKTVEGGQGGKKMGLGGTGGSGTGGHYGYEKYGAAGSGSSNTTYAFDDSNYGLIYGGCGAGGGGEHGANGKAGAPYGAVANVDAEANTGAGGGGAHYEDSETGRRGGHGGSGIVIIRNAR